MNATRAQRGSVLPLTMAVALVLIAASGGVLTLGAAHTAAARAQTGADVAAVAGARELLGRGGADRAQAVEAARLAARRAASGSRGSLRVLRVEDGPVPSVEVVVDVAGPIGTVASARARAGVGGGASDRVGRRGWATGGGYSGPLVYRDGKPTCPVVAAAFDRMDAEARAAGVDLVVTSGFRSDAEQAVLFRRHPDPRWVAPPGRSRHRDATELDISTGGGAGRWLRTHAARFGFRQRYAWEPWHWGYLPGCGAATGAGAGAAVPEWVPARYRALIATTARRERLSAALLAALLWAESGFDPRAVSHAGARGIAQLMPATARGLGVSNPFDPRQAVPAAGRLLAGHLRAFGSARLALAAYNAGPGAVRRYGGVPPYSETQAYVEKVLALAGAAGAAHGVRLLPVVWRPG